jgi:hypothetical protein
MSAYHSDSRLGLMSAFHPSPPFTEHSYGLCHTHISPHCAMTTSCAGLPSGFARVRVFSILVTTSMPSMTFPKTTCLPFK